MSRVITLLLTIGNSSVGPFNIYSCSGTTCDTTPIVTGVTRSELLGGYDVTVQNNTTMVRTVSTGICNVHFDLQIVAPTSTPTSTPTPTSTFNSTTTPTSTPTPTPTIMSNYISPNIFESHMGYNGGVFFTSEFIITSDIVINYTVYKDDSLPPETRNISIDNGDYISLTYDFGTINITDVVINYVTPPYDVNYTYTFN